jgi:hypothetical protein
VPRILFSGFLQPVNFGADVLHLRSVAFDKAGEAAGKLAERRVQVGHPGAATGRSLRRIADHKAAGVRERVIGFAGDIHDGESALAHFE